MSRENFHRYRASLDSIGEVQLTDSITSPSSELALTANGGKLLNDKIIQAQQTVNELSTDVREFITSNGPSILKQVASWLSPGEFSWTVPDLTGKGEDWQGFIIIKGAGAGGARGYVSGTRNGGRGGGEGCTIERYIKFTPGDEFTLTIGTGGAGAAEGYSNPSKLNGSHGEPTSFGTVTIAPGGNSNGAGGFKPFTELELVIPGADGSYGGQVTSLFETTPGLGGGINSYGQGGNGGIMTLNSTTGTAGETGQNGLIIVYRVVG